MLTYVAIRIEPDEEQTAREAVSRYGTMAAHISLVHIGLVATEEAVEQHIADLVRNIREQAQQRAKGGLGADLAAIWKDAALKSAQARLEASGEPGD